MSIDDLRQRVADLEEKCAVLELEKMRILSHSNAQNLTHKQQLMDLAARLDSFKDEKQRTEKRMLTNALIDSMVIDLSGNRRPFSTLFQVFGNEGQEL